MTEQRIAASGAPLAINGVSHQPVTAGLDAAWAARRVAAFDTSGIHRMGWPGDFASGAWLEEEAQAAGAQTCRLRVPSVRTDVEEAYVLCNGQRLDGLPMFDAPSTTGVHGRLSPIGGDGEIGVGRFAPNAASIKGQALEQLRRSTRHRALLIATDGAGESLAPINAQYFDAPFGPPVLQVAGAHAGDLLEWAQRGAQATLVCHHRREPMESFNLEARMSSGCRQAPLVILTPRTGWWESTAERAGGLVAWIAALQAAGRLKASGGLQRDVLAWATCGHELGHVGLNALTREQPSLLKQAACWLHLGANLGAAVRMGLTVRASLQADAQALRDLLIDEGYPSSQLAIEPAEKLSGEGHDLHQHGARVVSLVGGNLHFHSASDRWPGNVNAAGVASIARSVARWTVLRSGC